MTTMHATMTTMHATMTTRLYLKPPAQGFVSYLTMAIKVLTKFTLERRLKDKIIRPSVPEPWEICFLYTETSLTQLTL